MSRLRQNSADHQMIHETVAALKYGTPSIDLPVRAGGDHVELAHEFVLKLVEELDRRKNAKDGDVTLARRSDIIQGCFDQMIMDQLPDNVSFDDLGRLTRGLNPELALVLRIAQGGGSARCGKWTGGPGDR